MFGLFKRAPMTASKLAALLRAELGKGSVLIVSDTELVIEDEHGLLADICIGIDKGKTFAFITFTSAIAPNLAADLSLLVNEFLPATVDTQFMYIAEQIQTPGNNALN